MAIPTRDNVVTFGTFEVDVSAGEIRKSGLRVRLAGQPLRLLLALLARPGEVLTRDELQREIWGANTNVDFERGIASAINKLREALGDSADHPLYIETLPRKGYRFIAPVGVNTRPGLAEGASAESLVFPVAPHSPLGPGQATALRAHDFSGHKPPQAAQLPPRAAIAPPRIWRVALMLCGALALGVLIATLAYRWGQVRSNSAPPRIEQLTRQGEIYVGPPNPETVFTISTDGTRLYVPILIDGRPQLSSLALNGTAPQPISMPQDLSSGAIADISHDGSRLLVRRLETREPEQSLWIVPTSGSGVSRVGDVLAHDATWMPDDQSVLFAFGNDLGVVRLSSGAITHYASLPGRAFWTRWSPDGKKLRFTLLEPTSHSSSLWELDAETRKAHRLSLPPLSNTDLCCGTWTPSGTQFTFQRNSIHTSDLWIVGSGDHTQPAQLTNGPIKFGSPLPSRDGRTIFAFGLSQPGGTLLYDNGLHRFISAPHFLENAQRISFSRDGSWVAWTDPQERLWRARSKDGADLLQLGGSDLEVFSASWSPDGQQLLLMARRPGKTWQVYTVNAGGGAVQLVLDDGHNLADPQWSPRGSAIVFGREADLMGKENGPHDIQLFDLRNHQTSALPGSKDLFSPRWSPDGLWIAALSRDQARLMVYNTNERTWKTLFVGGAADPVWSVDSRYIYYHAFDQPDPAIMRANVGGSVERVADLSKLGPHAAESYFFGGITPDGSPMIELRVGTGNLYSVELLAK